ncbi:MAG: hypothetical protein M1830_002429 [Pleopsidium flavum]|nr:MAG: hypothetical protein M1830_002429 [Pleopsidium flavum]
MAQIWALLILEMADTPVLPFDMEAYAASVKEYVVDLEEYVGTKTAPVKRSNEDSPLNLSPLHEAADSFIENAAEFHTWDRIWSEVVYGGGGFESNVMAIKRMSHNTRMANFETHLLDVDGGVSTLQSLFPFPYPQAMLTPSLPPSLPFSLYSTNHPTQKPRTNNKKLPNRTQYKHIIFAPQAWSGYDAAFFPAIRDAVDDGDWALAQEQVRKVAGILRHAAWKLNH